ncbi:MAG: c-type cytochrome [Candidatus Acidiferrales bacterium]
MRSKAETRIRFLPFLLLLALSFSLAFTHAQEPSPPADQDKAAQLVVGKTLFVEKCGKCHDERGDKPLASGPPLNERKLTREEITRAVSGRLRDKTDDERAAVVAYIIDFLKTKPEEPPARVDTLPPFG